MTPSLYLRTVGLIAVSTGLGVRRPGELRRGGFTGAIDIEGRRDAVYRDELERTGQVYGLNYLRRCRGRAYVPNPAM